MLSACGATSEDDSRGNTDDERAREDAEVASEPVSGVTKLMRLPSGDTITTPVGWEFLEFQGTDSKGGQILDGTTLVAHLDCCGLVSERMGPHNGKKGIAANTDFYYGHDGADSRWLVATFKETHLANFQLRISESEALDLLRTYRVQGRR